MLRALFVAVAAAAAAPLGDEVLAPQRRKPAISSNNSKERALLVVVVVGGGAMVWVLVTCVCSRGGSSNNGCQLLTNRQQLGVFIRKDSFQRVTSMPHSNVVHQVLTQCNYDIEKRVEKSIVWGCVATAKHATQQKDSAMMTDATRFITRYTSGPREILIDFIIYFWRSSGIVLGITQRSSSGGQRSMREVLSQPQA